MISLQIFFKYKLLKLNLDDMRCQGIDNGGPMSGMNVGLQKRVIDLNPRAFFNPCSNQTLKRSVNDVADSCKVPLATQFFFIVQIIFVFLSVQETVGIC